MTEQTISIGYQQNDDGKFMVVITVKGLESEKQVKAAIDFIENVLCGSEFYLQ